VKTAIELGAKVLLFIYLHTIVPTFFKLFLFTH